MQPKLPVVHLPHVRVGHVRDPLAPEKTPSKATAAEEIATLSDLWSFSAGEQEAPSVGHEELESLWMANVEAQEAGSRVGSDFDFEFSTADDFYDAPRGASWENRTRVDRPPPVRAPEGPRVGPGGRFALITEAATEISRQQVREDARRLVPPPQPMRRDQARLAAGLPISRDDPGMREPVASPASESPMQKAASYAKRPTVYQRLMNTED